MASFSDFDDRPRRFLPEDELELLALLGSRVVGVNMAAMGIRVVGGSIGFTSSTGEGPGACVDIDGSDSLDGAGRASKLIAAAAAASALACCSAFVGLPRLRFGGGSLGDGCP